MRHGMTGRQLSRNTPHRWAMLRNMAASLLRHEAIRTTAPKAKELRRYVEPLITLGKTDSLANRRRAFSKLRDAEVVTKLFEDLGPRFSARPGGYTRILLMENRPGDSAPMAWMALVDQAADLKADEVGADKPKAKAKAKAKKKAARKKAEPADDADAAVDVKPKAKAKKKAAKKKAAKKAKTTD